MFPLPRRPANTERRAGPRARRRRSAAGRRACAGWARSSASCRPPAWPRRSTRRARARSARWSRSPATRWSRRRTATRLAAALDVARLHGLVDIYVNETTRHADVILPAPSPLERSHYDVALLRLRRAQRGQLLAAAASSAPDGTPDEWRDAAAADRRRHRPGPGRRRRRARRLRRRRGRREAPTRPRRPAATSSVLAELAPRRGPERLLDLMLRTGPYGLTLADARGGAARHRPRARCSRGCPRRCARRAARSSSRPSRSSPTSRGCARRSTRAAADGLVLVGRRHLRSNNSWMHNLPLLVRGPERCTAARAPRRRRAARPGRRRARARRARASARSSCPSRSPTRSCPAWCRSPTAGATTPTASSCGVAREHAGANSNVLADELLVDAPSGNAVLNGIPVELAPVRAPALL